MGQDGSTGGLKKTSDRVENRVTMTELSSGVVMDLLRFSAGSFSVEFTI